MIMLEAERIQPLAEVLFAGVLQLGEPYHMAVAMEDINAVTNYARWVKTDIFRSLYYVPKLVHVIVKLVNEIFCM